MGRSGVNAASEEGDLMRVGAGGVVVRILHVFCVIAAGIMAP
jgi:hypothetical protein